jgi:transcriptional regulator with XRE-family HTH domain
MRFVVASTVSMRGPFAANLRGHRERLGLSQESLGAMCGLHRTEISLLERRKRSTGSRRADGVAAPFALVAARDCYRAA